MYLRCAYDDIQGSPDNTPGIAPKSALQDSYKDSQKRPPKIA